MKKTENFLKQTEVFDLPKDEAFWNQLETKIMAQVAQVEIEKPTKSTHWAWRWRLPSPLRVSWVFMTLALLFLGSWKAFQYLNEPKYNPETVSQSLLSTQLSSDFFMDIARENIDDVSINDL